MKAYFLLLIGLGMLAVSSGQTLDRFEYFFDEDPGFGNATPLAIAPGHTTLDTSYVLSTVNIPVGYHTLYVRAYHADSNSWSQTQQLGVFVTGGEAESPIEALEYFVDDDPGVGQRGLIIPSNPTTREELEHTVALGSVSPGFHLLKVYARNELGERSLLQETPFWVASGELSDLVRVVYRYGDAFGSSANFTYAIPQPAAQIDLRFDGDANYLTRTGTYTLCATVYDQNGRYSVERCNTFSYRRPSSQDAVSEDIVRLYPNPSNDFVYVELTNANFRRGTFVLLAADGKEVIRRQLTEERTRITYSELSAGIYLAIIQLDERTIANPLRIEGK